MGASLAARSAIAEETESVHLVYRAPALCPSADELIAKLRGLSPRIRIDDSAGAARVLEVTIDDDGLHGKMAVTKDGAASGAREVAAGTCDEVVDVLAFAATLALDPAATAPVSAPDASDTPSPPPVTSAIPTHEPESLPPPAPTPVPSSSPKRESSEATASRRATWELAAEGSLSTPVSPSVTAAGGLAGGVSFHLGPLSPLLVVAGDFGESAPVAVPGEAGATVRFSRLLASLEGCPTRLPVGPLDLRACLRVEGGERTTAGEGLPNPQSVTRPWFALGVTAHIRAYLFRSLFADLGGLVLLPIVRDDVYARPSTPVQNVPWVGGGGELGHGVEFR